MGDRRRIIKTLTMSINGKIGRESENKITNNLIIKKHYKYYYIYRAFGCFEKYSTAAGTESIIVVDGLSTQNSALNF